MPSQRIDTPEYWIEGYRPSNQALEALYAHVLETMQPYQSEALAEYLITRHVDRYLEAQQAQQSATGTAYVPSDRYEEGQHLVFPALDGAEGEVVGVREGNNPAYGDYEVIEVELDGQTREFAAGLEVEHRLAQAQVDVEPEVIAKRFAPIVAPQLTGLLGDDDDWLHFGDRWILRALLPEVNKGHRNLAEAVIMLAGEPLPAEQILEEIDLDDSIPEQTRALALEIALAEDERFRNVGALESPLWTLMS